MHHLKPKPQGNAMLSVRITAAGAVFVCCVSFLTAPARACDDRYLGKCEKAAAAEAAGGEVGASASSKRSAKRVKLVAARQSRQARLRPRQAPRFATRLVRHIAQDDGERRAGTPMARRFRGFIDPQPMTVNSFEALRRPRPDAEHLTPAATLPANDAVAATDEPGVEPESAILASEIVPAPQPAESLLVAEAGMPTPVFAQTAEPSSDDGKPGGFPFHKLVLTLCAALGVASALRFIVRA